MTEGDLAGVPDQEVEPDGADGEDPGEDQHRQPEVPDGQGGGRVGDHRHHRHRPPPPPRRPPCRRASAAGPVAAAPSQPAPSQPRPSETARSRSARSQTGLLAVAEHARGPYEQHRQEHEVGDHGVDVGAQRPRQPPGQVAGGQHLDHAQDDPGDDGAGR